MPPSGTKSSSKSSGAGRDSSRGLGKGAGGSAIGKSSSKGGARGPTGPQGQARTSPAGSGGGKAGSISRSSSGPRGPAGPKGQARTSPAGGKAGSVTRTSKSEFQRFQERYPGGIRSMNVKDIPSPMPGGFGPAGNALKGALSGARGLVGRLTGESAASARKVKQLSNIEKRLPQLERMKQSEAVRLGKPSNPGKLPSKLPPMSLKQIREANKPFPGYKTWSRVEGTIDKITDALGYGTGPVARAKAAAVSGVPVQAAYEGVKWARDGGIDKAKEAYSSARETFGNALYSERPSGGYRRGGVVKKKNTKGKK